MCLGHDTRIAGGVLVVSVVNGELKEVCSAKVRKLGERVGQAWRLHVHPQDSSRAAYVNRKGEVKWNLQDLEVPTVEQCVKEDALEVQDIRELDGLGSSMIYELFFLLGKIWNLPPPSTEEPVTQIAGDVPVEPLPLRADATQLEMELQAYERPLAVTPSGTPELVPDWQDSRAMRAYVTPSSLGQWVRTDLGVRTFQGLGKNAPNVNKWYAVLPGMFIPIRSLNPCHVKSIFRCHCIDAVFQVVVQTLVPLVIYRPHSSCLLPLFLRGGGFLVPFSVPFVSVSFVAVAGSPIFAFFNGWCL